MYHIIETTKDIRRVAVSDGLMVRTYKQADDALKDAMDLATAQLFKANAELTSNRNGIEKDGNDIFVIQDGLLYATYEVVIFQELAKMFRQGFKIDELVRYGEDEFRIRTFSIIYPAHVFLYRRIDNNVEYMKDPIHVDLLEKLA